MRENQIMSRMLENQKILKKSQQQKHRIQLTKKPTTLETPIWLENEYAKTLVSYVDDLEELSKKTILPYLIDYETKMKITINVDGWSDDINKKTSELSILFDDLSLNAQDIVTDVGLTVNSWQSQKWQKAVKSVIGINLFKQELWLNDTLSSFNHTNVALIKDINSKTITKIETIIQDGYRNGKRAETIADEIFSKSDLQKGAFTSIRKRADSIARDQVNKLSGSLNRLRQNEIGISMYIWRTSLDSRVRYTHKVMEGRLCNWDNPTVFSIDNGKTWLLRPLSAVQLHPSEDYNCRCYGEPFFPMLQDIDPSELNNQNF